VETEVQGYREQLLELASKHADDLGLTLVELEVVGRGKRNVVQLFVDREGGVTVGECSRLSRRLSKELEEIDLIPGAYRLEVSSPGATRPFRLRTQYVWSVNKRIKVTLREPREEKREWEGVLVEVSDDRIVLLHGEDERVELTFEGIKEACRIIEF